MNLDCLHGSPSAFLEPLVPAIDVREYFARFGHGEQPPDLVF